LRKLNSVNDATVLTESLTASLIFYPSSGIRAVFQTSCGRKTGCYDSQAPPMRLLVKYRGNRRTAQRRNRAVGSWGAGETT